MTTLLLTITGVFLAIAVAAFFLAGEKTLKDKAKAAASAVAGGAVLGLGCLVNILYSAIPLAIAILIVPWGLRSCS